jgi:phosphoglycolate phosphatase-like HAD superfamily hydrolase
MKLFVWDFHGVLEKDNEKAVIDISNKVLSLAGLKERFTEEDNERFYGLKWYEYFERLLPGLSHEEHLNLQAQCFKFDEQNRYILKKHIKPNDHAIEVLGRLQKSGCRQIVISNTRQSDLIWFIEAVHLTPFFDSEHIVGVNAHQHLSSKADALKEYLNDKHFDELVVIGDSEDDISLGQSVGATTYFYKHAHRTHEPHIKANYIIKDLREVLKESI